MKIRSEELLTQIQKGVTRKSAGLPKNRAQEMGPLNWSRKVGKQHPQSISQTFSALPLDLWYPHPLLSLLLKLLFFLLKAEDRIWMMERLIWQLTSFWTLTTCHSLRYTFYMYISINPDKKPQRKELLLHLRGWPDHTVSGLAWDPSLVCLNSSQL